MPGPLFLRWVTPINSSLSPINEILCPLLLRSPSYLFYAGHCQRGPRIVFGPTAIFLRLLRADTVPHRTVSSRISRRSYVRVTGAHGERVVARISNSHECPARCSVRGTSKRYAFGRDSIECGSSSNGLELFDESSLALELWRAVRKLTFAASPRIWYCTWRVCNGKYLLGNFSCFFFSLSKDLYARAFLNLGGRVTRENFDTMG